MLFAHASILVCVCLVSLKRVMLTMHLLNPSVHNKYLVFGHSVLVGCCSFAEIWHFSELRHSCVSNPHAQAKERETVTGMINIVPGQRMDRGVQVCGVCVQGESAGQVKSVGGGLWGRGMVGV